MSADLLRAVVAAARRSAAERERVSPNSTEVDRAIASRRPRGREFRDSLRGPGVRIIAECKRRSPLAGVLRPEYAPGDIARAYQAAGAAAISVLTEPTFFDGSVDDLRAVRAAVALPVLCKDFLVASFQIREAAAAGADAVLLIVAALDDETLEALLQQAASLDVEALVEVHDQEELTRAIAAGATIVGVNSRNLRTLELTPRVFEDLARSLPRDVVAVAESGLKSGADVAQLRALGYKAFLIGERLMTQPDPGAALTALRLAATEGGGAGAGRPAQA